MTNAFFTNFTDEDFVGYWDGKGKKFKAGTQVYMPSQLAKHFARHLVNRELLKTDKNGNLIHPEGEKYTSPKRPEDIPLYMELFEKAYQQDEDEENEGFNTDTNNIEEMISSASQTKEVVDKQEKKKNQDPEEEVDLTPQDDDGDDTEEVFEGQPEDIEVEEKTSQKPQNATQSKKTTKSTTTTTKAKTKTSSNKK